jgi:hypothetical protein
MTAVDAEVIADRHRASQGVSPDFGIGSVTQRFIELPDHSPGEPVLLKDVLVWAVRFVKEATWVELLIADDTGALVLVRKSQGTS